MRQIVVIEIWIRYIENCNKADQSYKKEYKSITNLWLTDA